MTKFIAVTCGNPSWSTVASAPLRVGRTYAACPAGGGADCGVGMPRLAEIGGRERVTMQAEGDAVFEIELALKRRRRGAALAAGDLLGERADLGPYRCDCAPLIRGRGERAGGVD